MQTPAWTPCQMWQAFQIAIFFATGANSHSQFRYKAILPPQCPQPPFKK